MNELVEKFFFPKLSLKLLFRLIILAVILIVVFSNFLMPCFINGKSMEPTYPALGFNFCTKLKYKKNPIQIGDIVVIKYVDKKYFLKRVVALEGDTVEFKAGILYVNNLPQDEPYLNKQSCNWNLPAKVVENGNIYVVGDNRTMDIGLHQFGQVSQNRVIGGVLW